MRRCPALHAIENLASASGRSGGGDPIEVMRAYLREVQTQLNVEGLLTRRDGRRPGLVDGDPGEMTCKALIAWRDKHPAG
jgi:hypothetical protein